MEAAHIGAVHHLDSFGCQQQPDAISRRKSLKPAQDCRECLGDDALCAILRFFAQLLALLDRQLKIEPGIALPGEVAREAAVLVNPSFDGEHMPADTVERHY